MRNDRGELENWKANVLTVGDNYDDAVAFIAKCVGRPINVFSASRICVIDAISDTAINYIESRVYQ